MVASYDRWWRWPRTEVVEASYGGGGGLIRRWWWPHTEAVVASYGGGGGLIWRWRWPHTVVAVASYGGGGCLIWRWRWPHTAAMVASYSGGGLMWWWFVVFASLSLMHILHSLVVKIWVFYRGIWLMSVVAWWPLFFMYSSKFLVQKVMCVCLCWCYVCCCFNWFGG